MSLLIEVLGNFGSRDGVFKDIKRLDFPTAFQVKQSSSNHTTPQTVDPFATLLIDLRFYLVFEATNLDSTSKLLSHPPPIPLPGAEDQATCSLSTSPS